MTPNDIPTVVQRAVEAANSWQVDSFLDCFAPDGAVDDWGRTFRGRDAIRAWSDAEFIGVQVVLTPTKVTVNGDDVTVAVQVGGNGYNGAGHFTFRMSGSLISLMRITS